MGRALLLFPTAQADFLENERFYLIKALEPHIFAGKVQVFSIDSIITAIGMAEHVPVMILAVVIAMIIMFVASEPISRFIHDHPTTKMLALSFLLLIGTTLIAEGFGVKVPKGYIYAAMAFSALVEGLYMWSRKNRKPPPA